jgi:type I restriction enzyme M protein
MILHGDGSTNIFVKDGLLPFIKYEKETAPNIMHYSEVDELYHNKAVNGNFDLILTNPPFSVDLDNDTKKTIKSSFIFGGKRNSENLFIERWYQLLRENGRLAAILPESVFDTTENKYIRLFLYKYFKIKAVVSLPQLAFEPYTSTKTSILFAQKKTSDELIAWNTAWNTASKEYSKLKTRVENLIAVHNGTKKKNKLPSIKDMTADEEKATIRRMLKNYFTDSDEKLSSNELIEKYSAELSNLCTIDKDTVDSFGHVNTWWVFGEVASQLKYNVFMAEVDNIGYKRTKRSEKEMPNELFALEYAPQKLDIAAIDEDYNKRIADIQEVINKETSKKSKEKKADKIAQIEDKIKTFAAAKADIETEYAEIKEFIATYYNGDTLKDEYIERTDEILIREFKNGRLQAYRSDYVALHKTTYLTILDYMRDIDWE